MTDAISLPEAQARMLARLRPLEAERVPIERAAGRVAAEDVVARVDLPSFPSSAMDGFAVRAADAVVDASLQVVGESAAGRPAEHTLGSGEAIAISTGAAVPAGADAVVPVERVRREDGRIVIGEAAEAGSFVRPRGGDVARGSVVVTAGTLLGPAQVGALAAAGASELLCRKRPRVGILVTGNELRPVGHQLGAGEIYESNGLMLAAQLSAAGAVPAHLGIVADEPDELERTMERALLGFDMLITSGGASVGEHDLVRKVQAGLRVEEVFWRVAMRPGRPVAFGMRRDHPVFNLPGNPVSALVCFELLVHPAIRAMLGMADPLPRFFPARLTAEVARQPDREDFVRAALDFEADEVRVTPLARQESHMIALAARARALVHVPRGDTPLAGGTAVMYLPLD